MQRRKAPSTRQRATVAVEKEISLAQDEEQLSKTIMEEENDVNGKEEEDEDDDDDEECAAIIEKVNVLEKKAIQLAHEITNEFKQEPSEDFPKGSTPTFLVQFVHQCFIPALRRITAYEFSTFTTLFIHDDRKYPFRWRGISPNQAKLRFVMISAFIEQMAACDELGDNINEIILDNALLNHPESVKKDSFVTASSPFGTSSKSSTLSSSWGSNGGTNNSNGGGSSTAFSPRYFISQKKQGNYSRPSPQNNKRPRLN